MNTFIREQHKLINRIKYSAYKILFPISFINIFKSDVCLYTNLNLYDSQKIYNYLNCYNDLIIKSREHLTKLKEITKWGLMYENHILLKIKTEFLIKMINMYTNLILKCMRNNKKNNKIYDISCSNYFKKDNISSFMKIYKIENKYILINENHVSLVSESYIDFLFPIDFNRLNNCINHPLYLCDQL